MVICRTMELLRVVFVVAETISHLEFTKFMFRKKTGLTLIGLLLVIHQIINFLECPEIQICAFLNVFIFS